MIVSGGVPSPAPGVRLPPDWGTFWKPARDGSRSQLARIGLMGDSAAWGAYSSNPYSTGWPSLVAASVRGSYGDGGSGFQGVQSTPQGMAATGVSTAAQTAYAAFGPTAVGTWAFKGDVGPGGVGMYSNTSGDTLTFHIRGTTVTVYFEAQSAAFASAITWTIDGSAQTPINSTRTPNGSYSVTVSGLSATTHTVVLTVPAGGGFVSIYGAAGTNTSGVVLHNFSKFGAGSANFTGSTYKDVAAWSGGPNNPVDLLIYELGTADAAAGTAADTWAQNAGISLDAVRAVTNPRTDILIVRHHIGNADNATPQWPLYGTRAFALADAFGAGLVDLGRLGRNSWAYWSGLGYWSDSTGSGAAGSDAVHPGNAGHAYIANQILPLLTA